MSVRAALLLTAALAGSAAGADAPLFRVTIDPEPRTLDWVAPNGDTPACLLVLTDDALEWVPLDRLVKGEVTPAARLAPSPDETCAFTIARGPRGARVLAIGATGAVDVVYGDARTPLFRDAEVRLPAGLYFAGFARDLDGDGDDDLVMPHLGGLKLWFDDGDRFRAGPVVRQKIDVSVDLGDPDDPRGDISRNETIAGFDVDDQNGDGRADLVFRDGDRLQFFWSAADGTLPAEPTFELDLEAIKNELPQVSKDVIDPSNLLRLFESQVAHQTRDLDGDGCDDLLLRQGRKVSVYRGEKGGVDRSKAAQVLKTAGNLLYAFSFDDNGDGREDLALLCMSDVSLAQVVMFLVAGTEVSLDLFVYHQDEPLRFARKPSRRRSIELKLPSVFTIQGEVEAQADAWGAAFAALPAVADFDGDHVKNDVIVPDPEGDAARIWVGVTDGRRSDLVREAWRSTISRFDQEAGEDGQLSLDVRALLEWVPDLGKALLARVGDRPAALELALLPRPAVPPADPDGGGGDGEDEGDAPTRRAAVYHAVDLDGDGQDDVIAAEQDTGRSAIVISGFSTAALKRRGN